MSRNRKIAFSLRDTSFFPHFGFTRNLVPPIFRWAPPSKPRVAFSKNEVSTPLSGSDYFVISSLSRNLFKNSYFCP